MMTDMKDNQTTALRVVQVRPEDNVATALVPLRCGQTVQLEQTRINTIEVAEDIPFCHKLAVQDIEAGHAVLKYGECIGFATSRITAGSLVHVHNMTSGRAALKP